MCQCRYGIKEFMCFFDGYIQYFVDGFVFVFNFQCFMVIVFIFVLVVWYVDIWQEVYFYFDYVIVLIGFVVFVMNVKLKCFGVQLCVWDFGMFVNSLCIGVNMLVQVVGLECGV